MLLQWFLCFQILNIKVPGANSSLVLTLMEARQDITNNDKKEKKVKYSCIESWVQISLTTERKMLEFLSTPKSNKYFDNLIKVST